MVEASLYEYDYSWCADYRGIRRLSDALGYRIHDERSDDAQDDRAKTILRQLPDDLRLAVEWVTGVWHGDSSDRTFVCLGEFLSLSEAEAQAVYSAGVALAAREARKRYPARALRLTEASPIRPIRTRRAIRPKLRFEVLRAGGFRCAACGVRADEGARLHIDHIVPVAAGGSNDRANLQLLCADCNIGKGVTVAQ